MWHRLWRRIVGCWTWYLSAWWKPFIPVIVIDALIASILVLLTLQPDVAESASSLTLTTLLHGEFVVLVGLVLLMACTILGMCIAGLVHMFCCRIGYGFVVWLEAAFSVLLAWVVLSLLMLVVASISTKDHFADHLTLPEGVELTEPLSEYGGSRKESLGVEPSSVITAQSTPQIVLWNDSRFSGIYQMEIRCNPGEPGQIYLQAYEITHNTPLSEYALKERSTERIDWSNDANELFYTSSSFLIDEGDKGKPYAARFELWFIPDANPSQERKLLERNFKIEGFSKM